jgi:hypothetical protein
MSTLLSPWDGPPVPPVFLPTDEPWADYYKVEFPGHTSPSSPMSAFKYATTAKSVSRTLWDARERARSQWEAQVGHTRPWHAPVVLWVPSLAHPACMGCTWLAPRAYGGLADAAGDSVRHAVESGEAPGLINGLVPIAEEGGRCNNPLREVGVLPPRSSDKPNDAEQ